MADLLDVPEFVTGSPRGGGRPPAEVCGLDLANEDLDRVLGLHVDEGLDAETIAEDIDVDAGAVAAVLARYDRVARERRRPHRLDPDTGAE